MKKTAITSALVVLALTGCMKKVDYEENIRSERIVDCIARTKMPLPECEKIFPVKVGSNG